jgi:hypothetical protein
MSKFKLALVEIYNPFVHGKINGENKKMIYNSFIIKNSIDIYEFYEELSDIEEEIDYLNENYDNYINIHPTISNYINIIRNDYFKIEIIEEYDNVENISMAIKKTYLIKIIQKKWRSILKKRLNFKKNIKNLLYREIHGKYPK